MLSHLHVHGASHPSWSPVDKNGNTIGHLGVQWPKLREWVLAQALYIANSVLDIRNHQGETPAEEYGSLVKKQRACRTSIFLNYTEHLSDEFRGYTGEDTNILLPLLSKNTTAYGYTPEEREKVKWGSTFGDCKSYLSPRVRWSLSFQVKAFYEGLSCWPSSDLGNWIEWSSVCFQYLSPA